MLPFVYPEAPEGFFLSEYTICSCAKTLSGIKPKHYNCCIKSCVRYAGIYTSLNTCLECNEPHFHGVDSHRKPHPHHQFTYIPFIQRLRDYLTNILMAQSMQYRANCYVRTRPDPDVPRGRQVGDSSRQPSTAHTRMYAGRTGTRTEKIKDGQSRAGVSGPLFTQTLPRLLSSR